MENIDNKEIKTKKELFAQRLKEKYPEMDVENEELIYGRINDDYDAFDKELEEYKAREKTLSDMFTADPRSATFLMSWKNGGDPVVELIRLFGVDGIKEAIEDPAKLDEVAGANKEYLERVAKSKAFEEEYKANLANSIKAIDEMQGEDEEIDKAVEWIMKVGKNATLGIVTPEDVNMAIKAITFEKAKENAAYEGEVRGRNAKIVEKMKNAGDDGVAHLGSRTATVKEELPKRRNSLIEAALNA